ncbi:MAG: DUF1028 domain-containing protein [Candidatus Thorarchaeota archaeon]|nr:DUF1028 domain-containing protein [Candidatus Thorarchaeota archaeon]
MTFSIVAIDRENNEVGFAIASCTWDAGMVGTAKAEVGAICSQALGYFKFHSMLYERLAKKMTMAEILEDFKKDDMNIENRQIGMISFEGAPLSFTGAKCGHWAGHKIGENYACQGNILTGPEVIEKMAEAFEKSEGMLAERLYAALQAGDDIGGDIRGKISARVLVKKKGYGLEDTYIDFTIEDHDEPVREIGRLLAVRRKIFGAYLRQMSVVEAEGGAKVIALESMEEYLSDKIDKTVVDYHSFVGDTSLELGFQDMAIAAYRRVLSISPNLVRYFETQKQSGKMPADVVDAILKP